MFRLIKYCSDRLYTVIDSFFRGDQLRISAHQKTSAIPGNHAVIRVDHFEWELNQGFADIAARDAEVLFRKFTPHIFRKYIAILNQWIILFFKTDDEPNTYKIEYHNNRFHQLTKSFTIYFQIRPDSKGVKCCKWFACRFSRMFLSTRIFLQKSKASVHRIYPWIFAEPFVWNPAGYQIRGPGSPKLISNFFFHKRN